MENLKKAWLERERFCADVNKLRTEGYILCAESNKFRSDGNKLLAEGNKLLAEGNKLLSEGDKLYSEGSIIWIDAWIAEYGKDSIVDWEWGNKNL